MEHPEISAKTVEEAIQIALNQLGVRREEVNVIILSEGRPGILGLGAEEARIRVELLVPATPQKDDISGTVQEVLETLLSKMGITGSIVPQARYLAGDEEETAAPITFNVTGDDLGILIGRRGQTLASLQYVVRLMVAEKLKMWIPISVDIAGYKKRRYESLRGLALRLAEQVKRSRRLITLEPMPADERRIIHLALADHPDVATESMGEGEARKVAILLKKQ